jgi:hypothetical protein
MPSVHAASILGFHQRSSDDDDEVPDKARLSFPANRDGWVRTIKDLGLTFDFVSSEDVAKNPISNNKYKVLILPLSFALSSSEIQHIEEFVSRGGVVIADAAPGLMDQHCAWETSDALNKLFGITTADSDKRDLTLVSGDIHLNSAAPPFGLPSVSLKDFRAAEPEVKASTAQALFQIGNADAALFHTVGRGWTIYLNTTLDQYPKQRASKFGGSSYRELMRKILEKAGVETSIKISSADGRPLSQAQIARYKFGDSEILAVVKDNVAIAGIVGQDGVTTYKDSNLGEVAKQEITIKLPRKMYVADVRTGKQFGFTDIAHTSILVGDALVLGLSSKQNEISLQSPRTAKPGEPILFTIASNQSADALLRVQTLAPDGTRLPLYSTNVMLHKGSGTFTLPFALNDVPGKYTVKATDVVTGASFQTTIELK